MLMFIWKSAEMEIVMEKKICKICGSEFETELEDANICPKCESEMLSENDELILDEIDAANEETALNTDDEDITPDSEEEISEDEIENDAAFDEDLSEEAILALEEEARKKEEKKKTIITVTAAVVGAAVIVSAVLFVPFKKNDAIYRTATTVSTTEKGKVISKRTNLFNIIQSSVEFAKNPNAAMIIGGETIDKSLFEYFYERAQYNLIMENGLGSSSNEEINKFWDKWGKS